MRGWIPFAVPTDRAGSSNPPHIAGYDFSKAKFAVAVRSTFLGLSSPAPLSQMWRGRVLRLLQDQAAAASARLLLPGPRLRQVHHRHVWRIAFGAEDQLFPSRRRAAERGLVRLGQN